MRNPDDGGGSPLREGVGLVVIHQHTSAVGIDEAEARLREVYPSLLIHRRRGDEASVLEQRFDGDVDFNVTEIAFSLASSAAQEDLGGVLAMRTLDQPIRVSDGRRVATTERPVLLLPGVPTAAIWETAHVQAILLPIELFDHHVSRRVRSDEAPNGEHLVRAPTATLADQWNRFQDYLVHDVFRADGAFDNEILRATAAELCVRMMLAVFFPTPAHRPVDGRGAMPVSVRRAVAFVDEHAREPITIADIADAAGLSIRGLQAGMRRHLETTPYEYLRSVRLNGARQELRHPGPDTAVSVVARDWGFGHLGRFAGDYRELFGESPRATLQRGRD